MVKSLCSCVQCRQKAVTLCRFIKRHAYATQLCINYDGSLFTAPRHIVGESSASIKVTADGNIIVELCGNRHSPETRETISLVLTVFRLIGTEGVVYNRC